MRVAFGRCVLDIDSRELTVGGEPVRLAPKTFRLLEVLLESRPRAIAKAELHERLWPGVFVSEAALSTLVADLRRAIGDLGHVSSLIRTVHGYGYAFSGQASIVPVASTSDESVSCYLLWNARQIMLEHGEHVLGRGRESRVCIDHPAVSRRHARIVLGATVILEDLGSKNGTFLNDRRIDGVRRLTDGDCIVVGPARMVCRIAPSDAPTLTQLTSGA